MKKFFNKKILFITTIVFTLLMALFFSFSVKKVEAAGFQPVAGGGVEYLTEAGDIVNLTPCLPDEYILGSGVSANQVMCIQNLIMTESEDSQKEIMQAIKDQQRAEWWDTMKDELRKSLAGSFKSSLEQFARQVARDSAKWVASGGKGQKPLFITEGWGAYLQNAADSALGDFLATLGDQFGVNLCKPNFNVRIAIQVGLDYTKPKKVRCTFKQMMNNWQSAINNANFGFEYNYALRPGENDVSVAILLADQRNSYIANAVKEAEKEVADDGWKPLKKYTKYVLTPGSVIHDKYSKDTLDTSKIGMETFTNTIWDIVGEFLNTLVAQLMETLKQGLFSSGAGSSGQSPFNLPTLPALFNPYASPILEGEQGAERRFAGLVEGQVKAGGRYDILSKLAQCSDTAKNNPSPTDCVIDQKLLSAIKKRSYVSQLPDDIKDRYFAPIANQTLSLDISIPLRSVLILRKYRIVPIGWERAALYIKQSGKKDFKLSELLECYSGTCEDPKLEKLVDPYWVLKAPELFCRRQGYGDQNTFKNEQDGSVSRNEYCTDEQQCLQEDSKGNCKAYGYCTEERRLWDLGEPCDARNNTCQTFVRTAQTGVQSSLLTNTLDFTNCDSQNAGCRWYSALLNPASSVWRHNSPSTIYNEASGQVLTASTHPISQWHQLSDDGLLKAGAPCSESTCRTDNHCTFNTSTKKCTFSGSCTTADASIGCRLENCLEANDLLSARNGNFDQEGTYAWEPAQWDSSNAYKNTSQRQYRVAGEGKDGSAALRISSYSGSVDEMSTVLANITVQADSNYRLQFDVRKNVLVSDPIKIYVGQDEGKNKIVLNQYLSNNWSTKIIEFNTGNETSTQIVIKTSPGYDAEVYLDNFRLNRIIEDCAANSVWLYNSIINQTTKDIYFDRDVKNCEGQNEGCSQFIRSKAGLGSNLIINGGFEADLNSWTSVVQAAPSSIIIANDIVHDGQKSLMMHYAGDNKWIYSRYNEGFQARANQKYILSAWVFVSSTNLNAINLPIHLDLNDSHQIDGCSAGTACDDSVNNNKVLNGWSRLMMSFMPTTNFTAYPRIVIDQSTQATADVYFDDIKLEDVSYDQNTPSEYTQYNPDERKASGLYQQLAYLKKAPDYYNCYKSGGSWATNSTINSVLSNQEFACRNFAPVCTSDEVGCELYRPLNGDPTVPGIVDTLDYCHQECVGYQVYKQVKTNFVSSKFRQFIANNVPKYCSASQAGCDEFTNLDELGRGAEKREYYVQMKTCQKPASDDGIYYTWEGSDVTGFQLKVFNLKKAAGNDPLNDSLGVAPCVEVKYDSAGVGSCDDLAVNTITDDINLTGKTSSSIALNYTASERYEMGVCVKDDMVFNPDCREFYDSAGNVHYRLLSKTITVSTNCHPYRRTMTQVTVSETSQDCADSHGYFNANNECIYMSIPGEGITCTADVAGCRAYTGNQGNNIRKLFSVDNFGGEASTTGFWTGGTASTESTFPGGYSLFKDAGKILSRPVTISKNKTYILSFWAKGSGTVPFIMDNIKFASAPTGSDFAIVSISSTNQTVQRTSTVQITNQWKKYEVGPIGVDWLGEGVGVVSDTLQFITKQVTDKLFIDNVLLKEVRQNIYLLENSWFTPVSCDNKLSDPTGKDTTPCVDSQTKRCSPGEMLGCAAYKDRANTVLYLKSFSRLCRENAVGCEALIDTYNSNSPYQQVFNSGDGSEVTVPADAWVYLVNDKKYACDDKNFGCTAYGLPYINKYDEVIGYGTVWKLNQPDSYATTLCHANELWCDEYAGNNSLSYFKNPHGKVCEYTLPLGQLTANWYRQGTLDPCTTSLHMSYGTGYERASNKQQPIGPIQNVLATSAGYDGWAAACPASENTCAEYIDPLDTIYLNQLPPKCFVGSPNGTCIIKLKANTLYELKNNITISSIGNGCINYDLSSRMLNSAPAANVRKFFYLASSTANAKCEVTFNNINTNSKVIMSGVYYALANSVDRSSCNGLVDFKNSCVLFNDRSGLFYNETTDMDKRLAGYLMYDAQATYLNNESGDKRAVSPASSTNKDSNLILKVAPDRACNAWLYCTSYQKTGDTVSTTNVAQFRFQNEDRCLRLGLCSEIDSDTGICVQYEDRDRTEVTTNTPQFKNFTGYAAYGLYPFSKMEQYGNAATVPNGNFTNTMPGSNEPLGWRMTEAWSKMDATGWNQFKYSIESDPRFRHYDTKYLRLNAAYEIMSEPIEIETNQTYFFTGWINTLDLQPLNTNAEIWFSCDRGASWNNSVGGCPSKVYLKAGLPWTLVTREFTLTQNNTILMMLVNYRGDTTRQACTDLKDGEIGNPNYDTPCDITGKSLFDDFAIRPVLEVKASSTNPKDWNIERTCRQYPAQNSAACQYINSADNKFYYGWYGYCMMQDPQNVSQCLQWLPLDELKGDVVDEYSSTYEDRSPLYYCVEWASHDTKFDEDIILVKSSSGGNVQNVANSLGLSQNAVDFGRFITPLERKMFRYPFLNLPRPLIELTGALQFYNDYSFLPIQAINYEGGFVIGVGLSGDAGNSGGGDLNGVGISLTWGRIMDYYGPKTIDVDPTIQAIIDLLSFIPGLDVVDKVATPYTKNDFWGGWGIDYAGAIQLMEGVYVLLPIPTSWTAVEPELSGGMGGGAVQGVNQYIHDNMGSFEGALDIGVIGAKVVTDGDKYAGTFGGDPFPNNSGDIMGFYWDAAYQSNPNNQVSVGGFTAYSGITGQGKLYYCTKFVEVVTPSGINKAWTNRVNRASQLGFIMPNEVNGYKSDTILTNPYFVDGWTENWPDSGGTKKYWDDYNPKVRGFDLNGYNADYHPFGAMVPPAVDTQNPYLWDSLSQEFDRTRQPLLWEPPTLKTEKPYQARMGQPLCYNTVRNLFSRSFGVWQWTEDSSWDDGHYVEKTAEAVNLSEYVKYIWDLPTKYCPNGYLNGTYRLNGFARGINERIYICKISPVISSINVEYNNQNVAKLSFTVRVDKDQLPLTTYVIDWGDGYSDSISGIKLRAKPNSENPFTFYHYYSEDKLVSDDSDTDCVPGDDYCFNISIKAKDNWNAYGYANAVYKLGHIVSSSTCTSLGCNDADHYPDFWAVTDVDDINNRYADESALRHDTSIFPANSPCAQGWSGGNPDGDGFCDWVNGENFNTDPSCPLRDGDTISLRVQSEGLSTFLSVNGDCKSGVHDAEELRANRLAVQSWEQFVVEKTSANHGCAVGADRYGGQCLIFGGDKVQLKSVKNGIYLHNSAGAGAITHARNDGDLITFDVNVTSGGLQASNASPTADYTGGISAGSQLIVRGTKVELDDELNSSGNFDRARLDVNEGDITPCGKFLEGALGASSNYYDCTNSNSTACFAVSTNGDEGSHPTNNFYVCDEFGRCRCRDVDGDHFPACPFDSDETDCDDSNRDIYPGAPKHCDSAIDYDCNGTPDNVEDDCRFPQCTQVLTDRIRQNSGVSSNPIERSPLCSIKYGDTVAIGNRYTGRYWHADGDTIMADEEFSPHDNKFLFRLSGGIVGKADGQNISYGDNIRLTYQGNGKDVWTNMCSTGIEDWYSLTGKPNQCPMEGYEFRDSNGENPGTVNFKLLWDFTLRSTIEGGTWGGKGERYAQVGIGGLNGGVGRIWVHCRKGDLQDGKCGAPATPKNYFTSMLGPDKYCPDTDEDGWLVKTSECAAAYNEDINALDCDDNRSDVHPDATELPTSCDDLNCDGNIPAFCQNKNTFTLNITGSNLTSCDSDPVDGASSYPTMYLSVNSDSCPGGSPKSGDYGLNFSRGNVIPAAAHPWEKFKYEFVSDADGNGVLSRGDRIKIIVMRSVDEPSTVSTYARIVNVSSDPGYRYIIANKAAANTADMVVDVCGANENCTSNPGNPDLIANGETVCLRTTMPDGSTPFISYTNDGKIRALRADADHCTASNRTQSIIKQIQ